MVVVVERVGAETKTRQERRCVFYSRRACRGLCAIANVGGCDPRLGRPARHQCHQPSASASSHAAHVLRPAHPQHALASLRRLNKTIRVKWPPKYAAEPVCTSLPPRCTRAAQGAEADGKNNQCEPGPHHHCPKTPPTGHLDTLYNTDIILREHWESGTETEP